MEEPSQKPLENKREITLKASTPKEKATQLAQLYASPMANSAMLQLDFNPQTGLDLVACVEQVKKECDTLQKGDTSQIEAMLLAQAYSLQTIFTNAARKMASAECLNPMKIHGALALKAQNQCRQTLATLADIKNPKRTTFIKNQATNQQINLNKPPQILENNSSPISSNELLSEPSHATVDAWRTERQSELIQSWQPWKGAGVKTPEGKAKSKMNALKHGAYSAEIKQIRQNVREYGEFLRMVGEKI